MTSADAAALHCARGIGVWEWASTNGGADPDVGMVCAGDVPTLETLAAVDLLRRHLPELAQRAGSVRQEMVHRRAQARAWRREHGEDLAEVTDWTWPS